MKPLTERRSKIRLLLKHLKSKKLSSKSGAEAQMLQCYKDGLNFEKKIIIIMKIWKLWKKSSKSSFPNEENY